MIIGGAVAVVVTVIRVTGAGVVEGVLGAGITGRRKETGTV